MLEGQMKTVIWGDIDETFGLFAQFEYTGNYTPPAHIIEDLPVARLRSVSPVYEPAEIAEAKAPPCAEEWKVFDEYVISRISKKKKKKKKKNSHLGTYSDSPEPNFEPVALSCPRPKFDNLSYPLLSKTTNTSPRTNESANEDCTPIFLGHARLYVFAEKYDIKPLRAAALNKLHRTLSTFKLYEARYGDIVALIRYSYDNTPSRRVMDPLREMLVHYVAYEATRVARCGQCMELVQENGSFASDLLGMVLERVS
ncbi:hypothetical protein MMC30_000835 [Trapelia coarctata]|nr:hypothetical protein [Trapelia coarctata]